MRYKHTTEDATADLQCLWKCTVYKGDPDAKRPRTRAVTVVAWNAVDANRKLADQHLAKEPEFICWVWQENSGDPDNPGPYHRIDNPTTGPTDEIVTPTAT